MYFNAIISDILILQGDCSRCHSSLLARACQTSRVKVNKKKDRTKNCEYLSSHNCVSIKFNIQGCGFSQTCRESTYI